jgi:hypothetical protein
MGIEPQIASKEGAMSMFKARWMTHLWPGLPQLLREESWHALALAVVAAALLNLALMGTLIWDELIGPGLRSGLWMVVGVFWVVSAVTALGGKQRQKVRVLPKRVEDGFPLALDYYLKGNWFETERVLAELLRQDSRDVDARLMLATLLRHTDRHDEAQVQLDLLGQLEDAHRWQWEIGREQELLAEARSNEDSQSEQPLEEQFDEAVDALKHAA